MIEFVLMRGGTSKGIFLREADLPADASERDALILSLFGSPDSRQIDGLGGGDPLTSKVAIVAPAERAGADITYTFGQVETERARVDYASPCGNILAAVGVYAVQERYVHATEPVTSVRVFNTNLKRVITIEVPIKNGVVQERGDYRIPGVPGSGARIDVDFSKAAGGASGRLLPTGNVVDRFDLERGVSVEATLIDMANPHVYLKATDFGLHGSESVDQLNANAALLEIVEEIRGIAAVKFGLVQSRREARVISRATPMVAFVAAPGNFENAQARVSICSSDVDLVARLIFLESVHPNLAATSVVCTGVAARIKGSIVNQVARPGAIETTLLRIGHPMGIFETESSVDVVDGRVVVRRAILGRTARRLAHGFAYLKQA